MSETTKYALAYVNNLPLLTQLYFEIDKKK